MNIPFDSPVLSLPDWRTAALLPGCILAGVCAAILLQTIRQRAVGARRGRKAIAPFLAPYRQLRDAQVSAAYRQLQVDPDFIILSRLGLTWPRIRLLHLRLAGSALPVLALLLARFPLLPTCMAGVLGYVVTDAWLKGRWHKFRTGIEGELPTFVSRLGAMLLLNESLTACLEEVLDTLSPDSSTLRVWMEGYLQGIRQEGRDFPEHARLQANRISPSLALVVFQMGRVVETGGAGFARAFATSAQELQMILEVRAVAAAKADGTRNSITMLLAIMGLVLALMASSPGMRAGYTSPMAQALLMGALGTMAYGYYFLQGMITDVLD